MSGHWLFGDVAAWWYYFCLVSIFTAFIVTVGQRDKARQERDTARQERDDFEADFYRIRDELDEARQRVRKTDDSAAKIVRAVLPLVEKTDWMTGRWAGQFQTLVRLEEERNRQVERVQREIMALPAAQDLNKIDLLRSASTTAFKGLQTETGVPEGEKLEIGAVRRVPRVSDEDYYGDDIYQRPKGDNRG